MMIDVVQQSFDYSVLDTDTRSFVQEKTNEIHKSLKRTAEEIIKVGKNLLAVKARLQHGQFGYWLQSEFDMTHQSAKRFMDVAKRFGEDNQQIVDYPVSVLYELAAPSTPDTVIDMVEAGAIPATLTAIREAKQQIKEQEPVHETPLVTMDDIFSGFKQWHDEKQEVPNRAEVEEDYQEDEIPQRGYHDDSPLPAGFGLVNGKPFDLPLPDGKPITVPDEWKLPVGLQTEDIQREIRREQARENIARLREKGATVPSGTFSCLVVDPPWPMQKIERDVRPNQVEFDYPTMNEDELKAFPLPALAAENCHLYLWTTQKHLPLALRLAEHWGFKYQCLMTWVKNVGFTPFSWMYSTEHVLFCTKGSLPLMALGKRLDFSAKVREHSRKPDEFYDLVKEVSPGPRIDIFSREKRDGFEQYGNEVEKFV